jgi:hypothetical protein
MKVIFKRALLFRGPKGEKFHVNASANPLDAPEWLRSTSAFQLASKDGVAIEVISKEVPKPKAVASQDDKSQDGSDDDKEKSQDDGKGDDTDKKAKAAKK